MNYQQREAYEAALQLPPYSKPYKLAVVAGECGYAILDLHREVSLNFGNCDPIEEVITSIFIKSCEANYIHWRGLVIT